MAGPLNGVKVVEVAMWAFVPSAGGMLADMGADVIKIEPHGGDPCRGLTTGGIGPGDYGFVVQWEIYNRGKRSLALDLRNPRAGGILDKLLGEADVFLTSLLPPARRQMRIDAETIRARHPHIIYAAGSGTGVNGAEAEKGGFDFISFWSRGGVSAGVTPEDCAYPLSMPSGAFGDCTSGAMLVAGINAALYQRATTGEAPSVDTALLAASMWSMQSKISSVTLAGIADLPKPPRSAANNPLVNAYRTADGRFIVLSMLQSQRYWPGFCNAIGHPELIDDPRFDTHQARTENLDACIAAIDAVFAERTLAEWRAVLARQEGQWDVVQQAGEVHQDPQVLANQFMQEVEYPDGRRLKMVSVPSQFDGHPFPPRPAPELGGDSDDILEGLGYSEDEIIDLKVAGAVL
jgi:crotonobetainyl-CoA:carnitine CoA-transferase CaiB-like acyl-CoA transferase